MVFHGRRFTKKPPLQTWDEIERQVRCDQLKGYEAEVLSQCLYLSKEQVDELLGHVQARLNPSIRASDVHGSSTCQRSPQ